MKRIFTFVIAFAFLSNSYVLRADEGMWLPVLVESLNIGQMTELGFKLTAEDVYSINQACLKDAIVQIRGCTASLISEKGLLITNHHCAYDNIQSHSKIGSDYLTDGFWAKTHEEELPNERQVATFMIRAEDVTGTIMAHFKDEMTEKERQAVVDSIKKVMEEDVKQESKHYKANITPLLEGNQYMLFVLKTYRDIRLVGFPPESIGKYGADADNWMWPRHTGDFALYRIWADSDNEPADYSPENVPFRADKFLKISLNGIEEGDYAMIMGFPGRTDRYLTSWGVKNLMENSNTIRSKIRGIKQDIWKVAMDADDQTRIQYSSKFARSSNYWKYSIGQNQGLRNLNVTGKKEQIEADFEKWASLPENNAKYGSVLNELKQSIISTEALTKNFTIFIETLVSGAEAFMFAYNTLSKLENSLTNEKDNIEKTRKKIIDDIEIFYKDYQPQLDLNVIKAMVEIAMKDLDTEYQPAFFDVIRKKHKGNVSDYVQNFLSKSPVFNKESFIKYIQKAGLKDITKEPVYVNGTEIYKILTNAQGQRNTELEKRKKNTRLFVDGLMKVYPDKAFYSDANSTMRLTYGTVGGYKARDAVYYKYFTTIEGLMEKENPNDREFNIEPRLKELFNTKDYGRYTDKDGNMVVGFITNNDITGGNSGSPVMNDQGELIGCAFDGNWEAMSGDIAFENELQRCINVDIRYVLFIIDKFANAQNLIDEMVIVKEF